MGCMQFSHLLAVCLWQTHTAEEKASTIHNTQQEMTTNRYNTVKTFKIAMGVHLSRLQATALCVPMFVSRLLDTNQ